MERNPMSELSGLDLRKAACEAVYGGLWFQSYGNGAGFYHRGACRERAQGSSCKCGGSWNLPAIESDPAVSEPMFLEWLRKRNIGKGEDEQQYAALSMYPDGTCAIELIEAGSGESYGHSEGSTPSKVRARSIVEASKK